MYIIGKRVLPLKWHHPNNQPPYNTLFSRGRGGVLVIKPTNHRNVFQETPLTSSKTSGISSTSPSEICQKIHGFFLQRCWRYGIWLIISKKNNGSKTTSCWAKTQGPGLCKISFPMNALSFGDVKGFHFRFWRSFRSCCDAEYSTPNLLHRQPGKSVINLLKSWELTSHAWKPPCSVMGCLNHFSMKHFAIFICNHIEIFIQENLGDVGLAVHHPWWMWSLVNFPSIHW